MVFGLAHGYKPHDRRGRPAGHLSAVQGVEAGLRKQGKDHRPLVRAFLLHYIFIAVLIDRSNTSRHYIAGSSK
jgi:hypothetical protein